MTFLNAAKSVFNVHLLRENVSVTGVTLMNSLLRQAFFFFFFAESRLVKRMSESEGMMRGER